ncbi:MAG: hypothetical protein V4669_14455 [Pseudomonadota bacterium]
MNRKLIIIWSCAGLSALAGCADREQTIGSNIKQDTQSFQGTGMAYAVPGWKQGDKLSWEQQLKVRTQAGQNDYNRVN